MAKSIGTPESQWSKFNPGPTAQKILQCRKRIIVAEGALGTGKSSLFCLFIAMHCAENPGATWVVIRRTYRMLKDNTIATWLLWFPDGWAGRLDGDENFHLDCEILGRRAIGTIMFRPAERPEDIGRFMGGEYAGAALDEVTGTFKEQGAGLPEDVYTGLDLRLRQPGINWQCEACLTKLPKHLIPSDPNVIWTTCPSCGQVRARCMYHLFLAFNPPSPGHWAAKEFPLPAQQTDMVAHFRIPPRENAVNLSPGYYPSLVKRLKLKGDWAARFLDGERVPIGKATCVFNRDFLMEMLSKVRDPGDQGLLARDTQTGQVRLRPMPDGPLRVWDRPRKTDRYIIGTDSGGGLEDDDPSVAMVISRSTGSVVAEWHGNLLPRPFAREVSLLYEWYGEPYLVPEVEPSAHGRSTCDELENLGCGNLYLQRREQNIGDPIVKRYGLPMHRYNKVRILGTAQEAIEEKLGMIPNRELLLELLGFVHHPSGEYAGDEGIHDDRVMAWMCALEGLQREGKWEPVPEPLFPRAAATYLMQSAGGSDNGWMAG